MTRSSHFRMSNKFTAWAYNLVNFLDSVCSKCKSSYPLYAAHSIKLVYIANISSHNSQWVYITIFHGRRYRYNSLNTCNSSRNCTHYKRTWISCVSPGYIATYTCKGLNYFLQPDPIVAGLYSTAFENFEEKFFGFDYSFLH